MVATEGRIGRAVMWSGLNTVITRVVSLVMTSVIVRIVSPHEFGVFALALIVFTIITGLSELGLNTCLARHDLDADEIGPSVALLGLATGLGLAGIVALVAGPLTAALGAPAAAGPLRVLSLCIVMVGLFSVPCGLVNRSFRQEASLVANLVSFVPSNALLVVMALDGHGALAFAWSRVLGQLITGLVLVRYVGWGYWPRLDRRALRLVLAIGLPVAGASFVRYVLLNADYLLVGRLIGVVALGVYTLAFNVGSWASSVLSSMINSVAMPALSRHSKDPDQLAASLSTSIRLVSLAAFPIAGFSCALASPVVHVLYGDTWSAAAPILAILCVYGALFTLMQLVGNVFVAVNWSGRLFVLQVVWLIALVPGMILGVQLDGLQGAALAHIAVLLVVVVPSHLWILRKRVSGAGRILVEASSWPLVLAVLASVAGWAASLTVSVPLLRLLLGGSVAASIYLVLAAPLIRGFLPDRLTVRLAGVLAGYDRGPGRVMNPLLQAGVPRHEPALPLAVATQAAGTPPRIGAPPGEQP